MLKKVLVAIDESDRSAQVVSGLHQLVLTSETTVILAHVIPTTVESLDIASDRPVTELEDLSSAHLEQLKAYQMSLACPSQLEVVSGDPAEEIIRLAHIYQADLVVMGSRGLTGLDRVLQGSVSSQVVVEAPCSVLVIKNELN
ncbi:MAG: universal stress protein [Leptolyngbyaceae cyanobacterium SL_7_1]|nr:universal stress protein [Leptolyngbyaceae cyanobacterium SL_7_1]